MADAKGKPDLKVQKGLRFWAPRIAFAIIAPLVLLALTEGALRLFNVGFSTSLMESCTIHGPSDCYNLFFASPYFPPGMIKTPQFFSIDPVKPKGTYRIFVLGESAAMGDPDFAYGFSRYLEVMLRTRFPGMKFEVINTGMVAINSHVSLAITRGLAKYQPDLYVVYAGSNEVVGPYGPGTVLTTGSMSLPVIRASIFVRSSRIGQLLAESGQPKQEWRGMEMFLDKQVRAISPRMEPAYRNFASNLKDIVDVAHTAGARVLLCTVATNLRDSAPFGSLHRSDLTPDALHSWTGLVQQGAAAEAAQSYGEALKYYVSAAQIDDQYAELEFRIARCHSGMGNFPVAKEHYLRARDLDTLRFRADSRINDIIRATAKEAGDSSNTARYGRPARRQHPRRRNRSRDDLRPRASHAPGQLPVLARSVHTSRENSTSGSDERVQNTRTTHRRRVRTPAGLHGTRPGACCGEMVDRVQRPPFTKQLAHNEQLQSLMLRASVPADSFQATLAEYQWAIAQDPDDLALH